MNIFTFDRFVRSCFWLSISASFLLLFVAKAPSWPFFLLFGILIGYSICNAQWEKGNTEKEVGEVVVQRSRKSARAVSIGKQDLSKMKERIDLAIKAGEILKVKYMGGSDPGKTRELLPLSIGEDVLLTAKCMTTKRVKTYRIDKMEIEDQESSAA